MDLNLVSVKKTCSELSRNRAALLEYENTTLNSVMNMAGTVASTAKYYLWTKGMLLTLPILFFFFQLFNCRYRMCCFSQVRVGTVDYSIVALS